jgi:hypothetical protein
MSTISGVIDEYTPFAIGTKQIGETYCEPNPTGCCKGMGCGVGTPAGPDNTDPIIGWCVEYTAFQMPARFARRFLQQAGIPFCVTNPTDCCAGSGSSGSGAGDEFPPGTVLIGLTVQKTVITMPPGTKVLDTYCVFNPNDCCEGSVSGSASGSGSGSSPFFPDFHLCIVDQCGCDFISPTWVLSIDGVETTLRYQGNCTWTDGSGDTLFFNPEDVGGEWGLTTPGGPYSIQQSDWNCGFANQFNISPAVVVTPVLFCNPDFICVYGCNDECPTDGLPSILGVTFLFGLPVGDGTCHECADIGDVITGGIKDSNRVDFYVANEAKFDQTQGCTWRDTSLNPTGEQLVIPPVDLPCYGWTSYTLDKAPDGSWRFTIIFNDLGTSVEWVNETDTHQGCCDDQGITFQPGHYRGGTGADLCDWHLVSLISVLPVEDPRIICCPQGSGSSGSSGGSGSSGSGSLSGSASGSSAGPPPETDGCFCCPDGAPVTWKVTVPSTGWTNGTCSSCASGGGVYFLTYNGGDSCTWDSDTLTFCDISGTVHLSCSGASWVLNLAGVVGWTHPIAGFNCLGLNTFTPLLPNSTCTSFPSVTIEPA